MTKYVVPIPEGLIEELKFSMNRGEIVEIFPDGREQSRIRKVEVDRFEGLKVEIFSNEHPPPHFRVKFQSSTANFRISDCERLNGSGEVLKYEKNIWKWWKSNKQKLIDCWNNTRPSDCPVGLYKEEAA